MRPTNDLSIAVVCGGSSAEAEVSRSSGRCVADALQQNYSNVIIMEFDTNLSKALELNGIDVVFPALHGPPGEDGTFQGFLEISGYSYVGSDVQSSAFAMDKSVAKGLFQKAGIPVAKGLNISKFENIEDAHRKILDTLGCEVVVKPSSQGSAIGVSFGSTPDEVRQLLLNSRAYNYDVLVEERIYGREITVGVLDVGEIQAFPVIEIVTPEGTWYDFKHRYAAGESEHIIPASLPTEQYQSCQKIALLAHKALGCRDLSRADFIVPDNGDPILLEVNTLPGMTPTSLYPDGAQAAGISFEDLMVLFIEQAYKRRRS